MVKKKMEALLLAGGKCKPALRKVTGQEYKALMRIGPIGSKPMVWHMAEVLKQTSCISQLCVAGPKEVHQAVPQANMFAPAGSTLVETLKKSIPLFQDQSHILICTCDLPLATHQHIEYFIQNCLAYPGFDIYYAIIDKDAYIQRFPSQKLRRIYANLVEGSFTGGNLFLINPKVVLDCIGVIEPFIFFRKHPLKMAEFLGRRIVVKYLKGYLSIRDLEKLVPEYLDGYTGKAMLADAEIALDIDKPTQIEALESLLGH